MPTTQNKKEQQFTNTLQHLGAFKVMAYRHRRKHHHQYNSQYILQNQNTQYKPGELLLPQSQVIERLINNSSRRHRNHTT